MRALPSLTHETRPPNAESQNPDKRELLTVQRILAEFS